MLISIQMYVRAIYYLATVNPTKSNLHVIKNVEKNLSLMSLLSL